MYSRSLACLSLAVFVGASILGPSSLWAETAIWIGGNGDWNTPEHWKSGQVPAPGDSVTITNDGIYTVTLSGGAAIAELVVGGAGGTQILDLTGGALTIDGPGAVQSRGVLSLSGGTLTGGGDLTVFGTLNWARGSMSGSGQTLIAPGAKAELFGDDFDRVLNRVFANAGTVNSTGAGLLFGTPSSTPAVFSNLVGGVVNAMGEGYFRNASTGAHAFHNAGTLNCGGSGTTSFSGVLFNNTGTVDLQAGTLELTEGGSHSAPFTLARDATLRLSGTHDFAAGADIEGDGAHLLIGGITTIHSLISRETSVTVWSGTVSFDSPQNISRLVVQGGTVSGSGDVTIHDTLNWASGLMSGSGRTIIAPGAAVELSGNEFPRGLNRTFDNSGTVNATDAWLFFGTEPATSGVFRNLAEGVFNATGEAILGSIYGGSQSFDNAGTFNRVGAGTTTFSGVEFNNRGAVDLQGGTLALEGGGSHASSFALSNESTLVLNQTHTFEAISQITGQGKVSVPNGTLIFDGPTTVGSQVILELNGGTLSGTDDLTIRGTLNWSRGFMTGSGRTILAPGATAQLFGEESTRGLNRIFENGGTVNSTGTGLLFGTEPAASAVFRNLTGGVFNAIDDGILASPYAGAHTFHNWGTFHRSGDGTTTFSGVEFNNDGTVEVRAGTLDLQSGGSLTIPPASAFRIAATATIRLRTGDVSSPSTTPVLWELPGRLVFDGSGPRQLEVMGRDLGSVADGFRENFAYGTLELGGRVDLTLVDHADNRPGEEAIYVENLIVPAGTTLNLNGLRLYTRASFIGGTLSGGTIEPVSTESGTINVNTPTHGALAIRGESDEWTFFGRSGWSVAVVVETGGLEVTAPPLSFAEVHLLDTGGAPIETASNTLGGDPAVISNAFLPADGTYRLRIRAPADQTDSSGNYRVTVWEVTPDVAPLILNETLHGRIETPYGVDQWTFSAIAGTQVRFDLIASAGATQFRLSGPGTWQSDLSDNTGLITLPESGTYVLSAVGTGQTSDAPYAFALFETAQTDLVLGETFTGQFTGNAHAQIFRLQVTNTGPLRITLINDGSGNRTELAAQRGSPPTRNLFEFQSASAPGSHQEILIPSASVGTLYVLVYGDSIPTPGTFTIRAAPSRVLLSDCSPTRHASNAAFTLTLAGAGFETGTRVELLGAGDVAYPSSSASIDSYTHLTAGFPANFAAPGVYSIRVSQPGGSFATLTNAFEILPPGEPRLVTRLILPSLLGRHALATLYVEYGNEGNASMAAPLLVLKSNDPHHADQPILTQDPSRIVQNFWSDVTTPGVANEVFILASGSQPGVLNPGERIQVPVYYLGLRPPWDFHAEQVELEIRYWLADDHFPIDWSERKETLRPPTLDPETWDIVYANLTAELPDTGAYIRMLNDNAQSLARLGQRVTDVDKLWNFEVQQAYGHSPLPFLDSTVDASMPAPGVALQLSRSYAGHLRARNATGFFGRGWYTPWMSRLVVENEGAQIKILGDAGSAQHFTRDLRDGTYFSQPGETSTLVPVSSNAYELRDIHGIVTAFRTDGKLHYIRDPNGNKVTATYDGSALLTSLTHSSGATLDIAYNGDGFVQSVTDSAGRTTRYLYNGSLLETVTTDDGKITQYTYETAGPPVLQHALAAIARHGTTRHFTYDLKGRLLATWIAEEEELATFGYDSAGGVTATDAQGTTGLFFDHRGLLARTVNPLGHVTTSEFDEDLHPRRQVLPTGETRSYTWCSCGSPTSITDELGQTTRFSYEHPFKRLTGFTDALGNSTHYTYDDKGNRIATTYPNTSTEYFSDYTAVGLSQSYTNRRGQTIISTYTIAGLLDRQTFEDGSYADFDYDARGNLIRILEQPGSAAQKTTLYEYVHATDGDRLRRVTYPNGRWVEFFYDAFGRRERMTDSAGGNTRYQYDPAGRLWRLRDAEDSLLVEYLYNASGRLDRITRGNGTYTIYEYDAAGQILHLVNHALNGAINTRFDYTYDSRGRRRSMATVDGLWSYEYDGTSQLIRAAFASSHPAIENQDFEYKYDALGNRMFTIVNGIRTEYVANNMNQYLSVGSLPQEYDADGNLISDGLRTYGYDTLNRLTSILGRDGLTQYGYHAAGSRDRTTRNGEPTEYLMDPMGMVDVIAEFDATGMPTARSVHGIGLVGRYSASGGLHYFEFDAIGSTTAMTDPTGGVANAYAYRPFGEMLDEGETAPNSLRFVGQFGVSDNGDGTHYMRARFYDALAGRFMSSDPIGLQGGDPNLYRYVQNSAPNGSDPLGLDFSGQFSYFAPNGLGLQVGFSKGANDGGCVSVNPGLGFKSPGVGLGGGLQAGVGGSVIGSGSPTGLSWNGINFELSGGVVACNASWGLYGLSGGCSAQKSSGFGVSLTSGATYCAPPPASPPPPSPPTGSAGASGASATAGATDPNQKLGPEGAGAGHHVLSGVTLPYRVDFENDRDASAPAQFVRVTDQLSSDFDGSSFRLTEIGFGDHMIPVPPNRQHFKTTIAASYGGRTFDVHVEVGLRAESGQIYATFQSIDPATGLPPPVEIGFLPPEDGTGRGQGHFSYRIDARSDLPTGREIRNVAFIEFDRQASIATNQRDAHDPSAGTDPDKEALVTIDAGPPSGTVAPLPESVASPSFPVAWTGEDDAGGSGVADYTIYVSADDGPWLIWLERATVASANFPGSAGHSYRFRCVARDRVGHVEDDPGVAEASTRVEVGAAAVIGRYVSYNNSVWDGRDGAANAQDDAAIAPDKTPLLPGGTATFANYTSFDRGLNSVIIDIEGLGGIPTVADLEFRTGNSSDPSAWNLAPNPIELAFRTGAGAGGSDRITLIWLDNAIQKQWLQVHVLATPNTGLANPDVFYFGNAIGDSGDNTSNAQVNVLDEAAVRAHPHNFLDPAPLNSAHDFNRDRNVNVLDEAIARANATSFLNALKLITVPTTSSADAGLNARGLTFGVATRDPEIGSGTPRQQLAMLPAQAHEPDAGSPETDETGQMRISASAVGDRLVISVPTLPGRVYRLERADTLAPGAWTEELASPRSGVTGVASWSIALARSVSHRFYRVRIDSEY